MVNCTCPFVVCEVNTCVLLFVTVFQLPLPFHTAVRQVKSSKSSKIYLSVTHNSFILRALQCYIYFGQSILTYETLSRKHSIE